MADPEYTPRERTILFCPFCRDGFEGRSECPEHELILVPIDRLPPRSPRDPEAVDFFADPRLGRGPVVAGALLVLTGFVGPFVRSRGIDASALEVAIDGASNLWLTPLAASTVLWTLWVRRTRAAMRAVRIALGGLALAGALPLMYTSRRIILVADAANAQVEWSWGSAIMIAGLGMIAFGSARLGVGATTRG